MILRFLSAILCFCILPFNSVLSQGVIVKPGTKLNLSSQSSLSIINGGFLLLKDDNNSNPSFLQNGDLLSSAPSKVEQYLERDTWHLISSPFNNSTIEPFTGMYLTQYDEPTDSWQYLVEPLSTPMVEGNGYFIWNPAIEGSVEELTPDFVLLSGQLNSNSLQLNLNYTAGNGSPGWNAIGNPFPCTIEWNGHADWNLLNTDATIYVYDAGIGGGSSGNYRVFNFNTPPEAQIPEGNDGMIAASQGFWVKANANGASLTIPESQRSHNPKPFYKNHKSSPENILRLHVENSQNSMYCENVISFSAGTTASFDSDFDAAYIEGDPEAPQMFTSVASDKLLVNYLPSYEEHATVPLMFASKVGGLFKITASHIESFPEDLPVYIEDKKDEVFHNLKSNPEYSFMSNPEDNIDRFVIHFANPSSEDLLTMQNKLHIYAYQKRVYIVMEDQKKGKVSIYNLLGQTLEESILNQGHNTIPLFTDQNCVIVRVSLDNDIITRKLYIP